jgi:hypothetical protein
MPLRSSAKGLRFRGAGVLLTLAYVVESGLFRISRKLCGEISPAFYGLRTTLLTLVLMALLYAAHTSERDPAAFGILLGLDRAPEVGTSRLQLTRLAAYIGPSSWAQSLRGSASISGGTHGVLYVDGRVHLDSP